LNKGAPQGIEKISMNNLLRDISKRRPIKVSIEEQQVIYNNKKKPDGVPKPGLQSQ